METIRLNARARNQLMTLKRRTGIGNWNVLCRWALSTSLAEDHPPRDISVSGEAAIEMTWRTFGGEYADVYLGLLKQYCLKSGLDVHDTATLNEQLKKHLYRGIGYLASRKETQSIEELVVLSTSR
ncbi:DNA sulfur modification protein DndE [Spectribacter hydrogenoxidans]|uniref:DNA sulfur modification protein DndE n=1 Tax=Spectribacter hydrogenoxidans TaxID=3075608 RepID=UPI0032C21A40